MSDDQQGNGLPETAASSRTLEIITATCFLLLGSLIMWDSWRIGARWASDGPQSGFFPFYIGLLMNIASLANLAKALRLGHDVSFVSRSQIRSVLAIFIPSVVYVAAMQWLGLYVASAIFIAAFMRWQGKFAWPVSAGTGAFVAGLLFAMFEIWFKVPLIKGPLEAALGF